MDALVEGKSLPFAERLIFCHDCGILVHSPPLDNNKAAKCPRCGAVLLRHKTNSIEKTLAFVIAALILFIMAHAFPFMTFSMEGREQVSHISTGIIEFLNQGMWILGLAVFLVAVLIPLLKLMSLLVVLWPLHHGRQPAYIAPVFRFVERLHPWAMMEVYLLGVIVAYVKLVDIATIGLGLGLFAFGALILAMVAADASLEPAEVWERFRPFEKKGSLPSRIDGKLIGCHACDLVVSVEQPMEHKHHKCPRCGASLHRRKADSLNRTCAFLLTAVILYIPANVYPVMTVISFGQGEADTILSGVKAFIEADMWPLAILVFFASITVPMLKMIGLAYLSVSVKSNSAWRPRDRTVLYRVIEGVGRWSMIDVFMISILVALVNLGSIATIEPGVGATAFAAVVVLTMFASMAFDPRLIWDGATTEHERGANPAS
ncbi:MAG: paraquat-inducible protein A [Hyphomicrobiales bacterium]|nr:paraquat-inducible protein A [Hyphomicrobiales bacterium]